MGDGRVSSETRVLVLNSQGEVSLKKKSSSWLGKTVEELSKLFLGKTQHKLQSNSINDIVQTILKHPKIDEATQSIEKLKANLIRDNSGNSTEEIEVLDIVLKILQPLSTQDITVTTESKTLQIRNNQKNVGKEMSLGLFANNIRTNTLELKKAVEQLDIATKSKDKEAITVAKSEVKNVQRKLEVAIAFLNSEEGIAFFKDAYKEMQKMPTGIEKKSTEQYLAYLLSCKKRVADYGIPGTKERVQFFLEEVDKKISQFTKFIQIQGTIGENKVPFFDHFISKTEDLDQKDLIGSKVTFDLNIEKTYNSIQTGFQVEGSSKPDTNKLLEQAGKDFLRDISSSTIVLEDGTVDSSYTINSKKYTKQGDLEQIPGLTKDDKGSINGSQDNFKKISQWLIQGLGFSNEKGDFSDESGICKKVLCFCQQGAQSDGQEIIRAAFLGRDTDSTPQNLSKQPSYNIRFSDDKKSATVDIIKYFWVKTDNPLTEKTAPVIEVRFQALLHSDDNIARGGEDIGSYTVTMLRPDNT